MMLLLVSVIIVLWLCAFWTTSATAKLRRQGHLNERRAHSVDDQHPGVWPAPQHATFQTEPSLVLRTVNLAKDSFDFDIDPRNYSADIQEVLWHAKTRFFNTLHRSVPPDADRRPVNPHNQTIWELRGIHINITGTTTANEKKNHHLSHSDGDEWTDESYHLQVPPLIDNDDYVILEAPTVWGILHGLQTLWQFLPFGWLDETTQAQVFTVTGAPFDIHDAPAFPYRGLLIDTSRHYLPLWLILQNLDAMAMNKLNVLHWHVVDSQSWAYQSHTFPELSAKGAYCEACIYTPDQVAQVIHEAKHRGIRVVPEFDLPGHSQAIGASHPELLTACQGGRSEPLDVTQEAVYAFVYQLYQEINATFPSHWIHIGGDEVSLDCWQNNPDIQKWKKLHNMAKDEELLQYFETRLLTFFNKEIRKRPVAWQELFDSGLTIPKNVVVDVWKEGSSTQTLSKATAAGFTVLVSYCWYLDHLNEDLSQFYDCDPSNFGGTDAQRALVAGGHASMWGERVDENIFFQRVWPRAAAVAEKLWTGESDPARETYLDRLDHFRCLMIDQGIPVAPFRPGSCFSSSMTRSNVWPGGLTRGERFQSS